MKAKDLRNSILQLAVQGKLVPQDPDDEPASVLLERIRAERAKLIKEKKIKAPKGGESVIYRASDGSHYEKRGKGEPVCIDDEIPFEIPESWGWCRFSSIASFLNGDRSKNYPNRNEYVSEGMAWINTGHITPDGYLDTSTMNYITEAKYNSLSGGSIQAGDLVFCLRGATFGKIARVEPFEQGAIASSLMIIRLADLLLREYIFVYLRSPLAYNELHKYDNGSAQPNLAAKDAEKYLVPIPPAEEQARIVAQIAELSPLISDYGALEDARECLDAELPERLRKSILQLAVQGKLVEQDPADEPASALLERIRAERSAMMKARKLKAPKGGESVIFRASDGGYYEKRGNGNPVCIDDEIPFEIPDSWEWVRLPEIADLRIGKTPSRHDERYWTNGRHPWFSISDLHDCKTVSYSKETITDKAMIDCFKSGVSPAGTLLMSFKLTIGKTSILGIDAVHNEAIVSVSPYLDGESTLIDYLLYALPFAAQNGDSKGAIKGNTLNSKSLNMLLIPLPPVEEQQRITGTLAKLLPEITNQ